MSDGFTEAMRGTYFEKNKKKPMKTKAEIIQRLLEEKHIDVEEAMTLVMAEKEYIPHQPIIYSTFPTYPYYPQPNPWDPQIWYQTYHNKINSTNTNKNE